MNLLGYKISTELPCYPFIGKTIINTINPHSYIIAKKDLDFQKSLKESDILIPDGIGIVKAAKLLLGEAIPRIPGAELHEHMLNEAQTNGLKVFYLGASTETLSKIALRIQNEYPQIVTKYFSPPFKTVFTDQDNKVMIEQINHFQPDILFIGMTAPKQEKWGYHAKEEINADIICSIGAVFDFFAGTIKRPAIFWQKIGLEWLIRFIREPKRLWQRNFISTPLFICDVFKTKLFPQYK